MCSDARAAVTGHRSGLKSATVRSGRGQRSIPDLPQRGRSANRSLEAMGETFAHDAERAAITVVSRVVRELVEETLDSRRAREPRDDSALGAVEIVREHRRIRDTQIPGD